MDYMKLECSYGSHLPTVSLVIKDCNTRDIWCAVASLISICFKSYPVPLAWA